MSENRIKDFLESKNVPRGTFLNLELFCNELIKWNKKINLVSSKEANKEVLYDRHILNCLDLYTYIVNIVDHNINILDLGSGAGFPGIVMALCGIKNITLIESCSKKASFLIYIKSIFKLDVQVINKRIEDIDYFNGSKNIITSRALADISKLISLSEKFLSKETICLFLKGNNVINELNEARENWNFEYEIYSHASHENSYILKMENVSRKK